MKLPHTTIRKALLFLLIAGIPGLAPADPCVSTNGQLKAALATAQFVPQNIQIEQGSYDFGALLPAPGYPIFLASGTNLRGGYTSGCSGRNIAGGNTVLTNTSNGVAEIDAGGDLTIEGMTFEALGMEVSVDNNVAEIPNNTQVTLRRDEFTAPGDGVRIYWNQDDDLGGNIRVVDTLIENTVGGPFACALDIDVPSGSPDVTLVNNTIMDNANPTAGMCLRNHYVDVADGHATLSAYNNIFYGNHNNDLVTDTFGALAVENVIGAYSGPGLAAFGTLTGNPKVDANYRPIESPPSPVINAGSNSAPGGLPSTDLPGRARVIGSAPDLGAFESNVDDSFILQVTNANDSGGGSLREAITSANSNGGFNIIEFSIGNDCGPQVITLASALPSITSSVLVNGYTQPGSSENTLDPGDNATFCVILDGDSNGISNGFTVPSSVGNGIALTVEGVAFSGFSHAAMNLQGGSGHVIEGDRVGGNASGVGLAASKYGVLVASGVSNVTIGGDGVDNRNILGATTDAAIFISGSGSSTPAAHDNQIVNNYIGVGWSVTGFSFTNRGTGGNGIVVEGSSNSIIDNLIGYNTDSGLALLSDDAHDNTVSGNFIGAYNAASFGNGAKGIYVQSGNDNAIKSNAIMDNGQQGIDLAGGLRNLLRANQIYANGAIGIDLGDDGITPNDNDSMAPAGSANRFQNFPVINKAIGGHYSGTIGGFITSTPGDYRIELFASTGCDPSGNGQGEFYLGHVNVTIPNLTVQGQGTVSFSATLAGPYQTYAAYAITATATDSNNDTSEFSTCFNYTDDTIFADGFQAIF